MAYLIRRATLADLDALAVLFDAYRSFYDQAPDVSLARAFLQARMENEQSIVLVADRDGELLGFTQLYPTFSSVRAARVWVLNDLFVTSTARRLGVARALSLAAIELARADGAVRVELETMPDNHSAQALYEATGWRRHDETLRYRFALPERST